MSYLKNYTKVCKDTIGKLKKVYLAKFVEFDESEIIAYDGTIDTFPDTIFFTFDVEGSYTQTTSNNAGLYAWEQSIQIDLHKMYDSLDPSIFTKNRFRLIGLTNNGFYLMFGMFNGLDAELNNTSGEEKNSFNGLSLTFKGSEEEAANLTDINDYYLFDENEYFNYSFNFEI